MSGFGATYLGMQLPSIFLRNKITRRQTDFNRRLRIEISGNAFARRQATWLVIF